MTDIIQYATRNAFDTVLHVGDFAYDFEDLFSVTGNTFMNLAQGYQTIKPVAVAEGNHVRPRPARAAQLRPVTTPDDPLPNRRRARSARPCPILLGRMARAITLPSTRLASTVRSSALSCRNCPLATLTADPFARPTTPTPTGVSLNSNTGNNRFYSFDDGLTHFLVFSAEAYVYARDAAFLANQLAFMKADLAAVNRSATPWVVALVHKDWTMGAEGAF